LNDDLLRVYGDGFYERVDYTLVRERDRNILRVTPVEKAWGPNYLRFGLSLETNFGTGSTYSLRAAYHRTWADALGAELLVMGEIGNTTRLAFNYYQPLEATQTYFVDPLIYFQRENFYLFQDGKRLAEFDIYDYTADLPVGIRIGTLGQAKIGWEETRKKATRAIGPAVIPSETVTYGGWYARVDLDHLDRIFVPRSGWAASARYFDSAEQGFSKLQAEVQGAYPMGDFVIQGRASYVGSPVGTLPWYDPAKLGGFLNMSAFARDQMLADSASYAGLRVERIIGTLPLGLRGDMRVGVALEGSRMVQRYTETTLKPWQNSIGIYLGGETPIGPVFVGYGYSSTSGYSNAYLLIGTP
jgi:NTE family protein